MYVCMRGELSKYPAGGRIDFRITDLKKEFRRVLSYQSVQYIAALQNHKKIVLLTDGNLLSYSMDIMARVSQSLADPKALDASMEKVSEQDNVVIARAGVVRNRTIGTLIFFLHGPVRF